MHQVVDRVDLSNLWHTEAEASNAVDSLELQHVVLIFRRYCNLSSRGRSTIKSQVKESSPGYAGVGCGVQGVELEVEKVRCHSLVDVNEQCSNARAA